MHALAGSGDLSAMSGLRPRLARLFAPLAFAGDRRAAATFASFARAEEGSRRDLLLAAAATESPKRAALYLKHAGDEARHAKLFAAKSRAHDLAAGRARPRRFDADVEALYDRLGEEGFVAFAHRGEARGRAQFEAYRGYFEDRGDEAMAAAFEGILEDERRHERYTRALLVELCGGEAGARRALRRVTLWEAGRAFRRKGRATAELLWALVATLLYLASAPLGLLTRLLRPPRRGFLPPDA